MIKKRFDLFSREAARAVESSIRFIQ
jgi:hypothetical protein